LRRTKHEGLLNIQPLVIRSLPHSSSSLECAERKTYNEKMQFVQIIIHDIYRIGTSIVEFCAKVEVGVQESSDKTRSYINRSNVH
jgi:hypothetical protein